MSDLFSPQDPMVRARGSARLLSSRALATPLCWQFHRPYIVLPENLLALDVADLTRILRHESEHLRLGHSLHLFLHRIVEVVYWFHPAVWWASHQASLAREFACDDAAIERPDAIADYLRTLLTVVELGEQREPTESMLLHFGRGRSNIAARARRLVRISRTGNMCRRKALSWLTTVTLVMVTAMTAFVWLPVDVLASPRARWSPWPSWSSRALHSLGITSRDYEVFDPRSQPFELYEALPAAPPDKPNR